MKIKVLWYRCLMAFGLCVSFPAVAESDIFLCYDEDTGIVGDSDDINYRNCSKLVSAGEAIELASPDRSRSYRSYRNLTTAPIPIEVEKLFDGASPQLREHALTSETINGYLIFVAMADGKNSGPQLKIEFQNASIVTIKINFGTDSARTGTEYVKFLPQQITWTVYDRQGKGSEVSSFKWDIQDNVKY